MKKLLTRLLMRILNQFGLHQVFHAGKKKCTRRPRMATLEF